MLTYQTCILLISVAVTSVVSCGKYAKKDGSDTTTTTSSESDGCIESNKSLAALSTPDSSERPACDASSESDVIYVINIKQFQVCSGGKWTAVKAVLSAGPDESNTVTTSSPAATIYQVLDTQNNVVGFTDAVSFAKGVTKEFMLEDGSFVPIDANGRIEGYAELYYPTTDCSGPGYQSPVWVPGNYQENYLFGQQGDPAGTVYVRPKDAPLVTVNVNSRWSGRDVGVCQTYAYGVIQNLFLAVEHPTAKRDYLPIPCTTTPSIRNRKIRRNTQFRLSGPEAF